MNTLATYGVSMMHIYALILIFIAVYWVQASPTKRTNMSMGMLSLASLVQLSMTTFIGLILTAMSILIGYELSVSIHELSLATAKIFGGHIRTVSMPTSFAFDTVLTVGGFFLAIVMAKAIDPVDEDHDFHIDLWIEQKNAYQNKTTFNSGGAVLERLYKPWGMFKDKDTKKLTPVSIVTLFYLAALAIVIAGFMFGAVNLFAVTAVIFFAIPVVATAISYYAYYEHGAREKILVALMGLAIALPLIYTIISYWIYQYTYLYPYQLMLLDPNKIATLYTSNPATAIQNGVLKAAYVETVLQQWRYDLVTAYATQAGMFVLDVVAGLVAASFGSSSGTLSLGAAMEKVTSAIAYNQMSAQIKNAESNNTPEPKQKTENTSRNNGSSNTNNGGGGSGSGNSGRNTPPPPSNEEDEDDDLNL